MASLPTLRVAQVLADLNSLHNTDPRAAFNLLNANKTLDAQTVYADPKQDDSGKRRTATPSTLHRDNSGISTRSGSERAFGTPMLEEEVDEDMRRARELVELYRDRDRLKGIGDIGLAKAKERVDAVIAMRAKRFST